MKKGLFSKTVHLAVMYGSVVKSTLRIIRTWCYCYYSLAVLLLCYCVLCWIPLHAEGKGDRCLALRSQSHPTLSQSSSSSVNYQNYYLCSGKTPGKNLKTVLPFFLSPFPTTSREALSKGVEGVFEGVFVLEGNLLFIDWLKRFFLENPNFFPTMLPYHISQELWWLHL